MCIINNGVAAGKLDARNEGEKWSDKLVQTLGKNFQLCREGHKLCMASGLQILWIVANTFCQQARGGEWGWCSISLIYRKLFCTTLNHKKVWLKR